MRRRATRTRRLSTMIGAVRADLGQNSGRRRSIHRPFRGRGAAAGSRGWIPCRRAPVGRVTPGPRAHAHRTVTALTHVDTIDSTMTDTSTPIAPRKDRPARRSRIVQSPLRTFFKPNSVALIGATEKPGSVGRTILTNLIASPFGGTVYPVNPNRPSILGIQCHPDVASIPEQVDLAIIVTPPASIPGLIAECGRRACPPRSSSPPASRRSARPVRPSSRSSSSRPAVRDARHRSQLPRRHEPHLRAQRHVRGGHGAQGPGRLPGPERRAHHGHPRLEPARAGRLQLHRLPRLHGRRGLGRPHRLPGRRPRHRRHRPLHGDGGRRARLPLRGARGGARQAHHRHEARPHGGGLTGGRLPHRLADRLGRGARRGLPARRRAPRRPHLRPLLLRRGPGQAAAAQGSAAHRAHERGRAGGPGHRRAHPRWRQAGPSVGRDDGGAQRGPAGHLEPRQPHRHHRRRPAGPIRGGARDPGARPRQRRAPGHPHAAGDDRPDEDRAAARALRRRRPQAHPGELDGRQRRGHRRAHPQRGRRGHVPVSRQRGAHVHRARPVRREPEVALRDARPDARLGRRPDSATSARQLIERRARRRAARRCPSPSPRSCSTPTASRSPRRASATTEDEAVAAAEAIGYPVVVKLLSHTITHKSDVGRRAPRPARRGGRAAGATRASGRRRPEAPASSTSRA